MKRLAFIEMKVCTTDAFRMVSAEWKGDIDAPLLVDIDLLNDKEFLFIPFKLQRIKNLNSNTAMFIRVDWRARILRLIHKFWWGK